MGYLTDSQITVTNAVADAVSALSLVGSLVILLNFLWIPRSDRNFPLRLLASLSLADMLYQIFDFVQPTPQELEAMDRGSPVTDTCWVQALGDSYFELSSVLWTAAISATAYLGIVRGWEEKRFRARWPLYCLFAWGLPLLFTVLPLSTSAYGPAGAWCWIVSSQPGWQFGQFYGPLWLSVLFNSVVCARVLWELRARAAREGSHHLGAGTVGVSPSSLSPAAAALDRGMRRLPWYPFILVMTYGVGSVNRAYEAATGRQLFWLYFLQKLFNSSQGFANAIVFGCSNPRIAANVAAFLRALLACCCPCCCGGTARGTAGSTMSMRALAARPSLGPERSLVGSSAGSAGSAHIPGGRGDEAAGEYMPAPSPAPSPGLHGGLGGPGLHGALHGAAAAGPGLPGSRSGSFAAPGAGDGDDDGSADVHVSLPRRGDALGMHGWPAGAGAGACGMGDGFLAGVPKSPAIGALGAPPPPGPSGAVRVANPLQGALAAAGGRGPASADAGGAGAAGIPIAPLALPGAAAGDEGWESSARLDTGASPASRDSRVRAMRQGGVGGAGSGDV